MTEDTIEQVLRARAASSPAAVAIDGPRGRPLDYAGLWEHTERVREALVAMCIGRGDRVAIVLPNGPEMAVAFLGVAACAVCAPLNPTYRTAELEFYLGDLGVGLLLVGVGTSPAAEEVAKARGIPIAHVVPTPDRGAGTFDLVPVAPAAPRAYVAGWSTADELAMVLHTSGTTSRPKLVPLLQRNLCASARSIASTLALQPSDVCQNVMPLFHIHGLMAATLSSITAGARVYCAPGFVASDFFQTLRTHAVTWYTAVPTIHQAALAHARATDGVASGLSLRLVRSSSASLAPTVMRELEQTFGVPVIEAYGMTEASHQMASNPLPPRAQKPSSVGLAAGPEIAIFDEAGAQLPAGQRGEVVIRGPGVTAGYLANPDANAKAYVRGWFRTGDQGYLDDEGYLYLTGRLKEQINRAGEKISPLEVDELLLQHPAVAQAVTFALPHETLGEVVAAAVVLRPGASASEEALRAFLGQHLAEFKVPQRVIALEEIPKGATGKIQRIGLAEKLATRLRPDFVAPVTPTEKLLAKLWSQALGVADISTRDNFFFVGGDSLRVMAIIDAAAKDGVTLQIEQFATYPTIEELAAAVTSSGAPRVEARYGRFVELRPGSPDVTLCLFPPASGSAINYAALGRRIGGHLAVAGFESPEIHGPECVYTDLRDMADHCTALLLRERPHGALVVGGYSIGAALAFEVAQRVRLAGRELRGLVMVDPEPLLDAAQRANLERQNRTIAALLTHWDQPPAELVEAAQRLPRFSFIDRALAALRGSDLAHIETEVERLVDVWEFARLERLDRPALVALGAHDVIAKIFAALAEAGSMESLIGPVVRRIGSEPLTAFRVIRTQLRSLGMYATYEPQRADVGRAVLVRRAINVGAEVWRSLVEAPLETHELEIEDHLELISNNTALTLITTITKQLTNNIPTT